MAAMTRERFAACAEAYGGDPSRWPAQAREAAALLMAAEPAFAHAALARAGRLDAVLDAWAAVPADAALAGRILAAAPAAPRRRWPAWLSPAALGAGLAAACAAGVVVGVQVSDQASAANEMALASALDAASSLDVGEGA
jgi:hypothetical protein